MPFESVKDVPEAVPAEFRKQWLEVWNSVYAKAVEAGKPQSEAEAEAFAQANGVVKKRVQSSELKVECSELGDTIRALRKEKGISIEELASAMGIDSNTLDEIELGKIERPPDERLHAAAKKLGVSFESLIQHVNKDRRQPEERTQGGPAKLSEDDFATIGGEKVKREDFAFAPVGSSPSEWKLPIHDASHTRNALARFNQTDLPAEAKAGVKAKILRAAKKFGIDASGFEEKHKASEEPRMVWPLLSEFIERKRIPIALTGAWIKDGKKFSITLDDLKQIIANFKKRKNGEINVDYDHASEMPEVAAGGPIPSAGKLTGFDEPEERLGGRHMLWGHYEPTDRARQLIASREYRFISPAIDWQGKDKESGEPQGTTLSTVALTNRPFFEELPELRLSDGWTEVKPIPRNISSPRSAGKGEKMKTFKVKKLADGEHKGKHGVFDDNDMIGLAEIEPDADDKTKASEALVEIGFAEGTEFSEIKTLVECGRAARQATALSECVVEGKINLDKAAELSDAGRLTRVQERQATKAEKLVETAIASGKFLPAEREFISRIALSEPARFEAWLKKKPAIVNLSGPMGNPGGDSLTLSEQVDTAVAELMAGNKDLTRAAAQSLFFERNPQVYEQYRQSQRKVN